MRLPVFPRQISTQIYIGIGGALLLTFSAGLTGMISFEAVGRSQTEITSATIPELTSAFTLARHTSTLLAAGPQIITSDSQAEFERVNGNLEAVHDQIEAELAKFSEVAGGGERIDALRDYISAIDSDIAQLATDQQETLQLDHEIAAFSSQVAILRSDLDDYLAPAIDDQLFYLATGLRGAPGQLQARPEGEYFTQPELSTYRRLAEIQADAEIAGQLLASAFTLTDAATLEPIRERYEAAAERIELGLAGLGNAPVRGYLDPIFGRLDGLALANGGGFDLLERRLRLGGQQAELLARTRITSQILGAEVDGLVKDALALSRVTAEQSRQSILVGRVLLVFISIFAIVGGVLIAYFYVGRVLSRRIGLLSNWMRRLAGGDLEARVILRGQDEIAEMARALEVFRRHALEVQRLNLVEQLAGQLQSKNDELETTLEQLRRAQGQVVAQEKLAALGELTAAVAHEIRNPLNFIKNFSEGSEELIEELTEIVDPEAGQIDQEGRELIIEIAGDLAENLGRIRSHGDRAENIVTNMLRMGRGSGEEMQATDICQLVTLHTKLAYQAARSRNPDLNIDVIEDLDSELGEISLVSQDMGRVLLNLVANACDASYAHWQNGRPTSKSSSEENGAIIRVTAKRENGEAKISIWDNGAGIPADLADKIFNPFFTTKPPDKGTGLGLSISNDIVARRGGTITVESVPGEFTRFLVSIPIEPPAISLAG